MSYSLNEVETLCRKAARGAGYGWGLAEEAGHAARWLEARGCLGAQSLAALLEEIDGSPPANMTPRLGAVWQASTPLCPIITGAALSDHAALLTQGPITLGTLRHPLLLLPFAAMAAGNGWLTVTWDGTQVVLGADSANAAGNLGLPQVAQVICTLTDTPTSAAPSYTRSNLTAEIHTRLTRFAQRTYAPATEASRIAGAGAGLSDND